MLGDTLRTFANGRKDDWDVLLPYAVFFAINNAALTLGGDLTPFFIDRGQRQLLPLSLPDLQTVGESAAAYATRMTLEQEVRALLHAAQHERKSALGPGRVDTQFRVGDQVMPRTKELPKLASSVHGERAPFPWQP